MFKKLRIKRKLTLSIGTIAILGIVAVGLVSYITAGNLGGITLILFGIFSALIVLLSVFWGNAITKPLDHLCQQEEEYRTLFENLNVGVYRCSGGPYGRFLKANPAIADIFGYDSVEEFLNTPVSELYQVPEDRQRFVKYIAQRGFVKDMEKILKKKNGETVWVSVNANVQYDENGDIKWIDGMIKDITERKQTEKVLAQERHLLRTLINNMPDYIYVKDTGSRFLFANKTAVRSVGATTPDELVGKTDFDFFPTDIAAQFYKREQDVLESGKPMINREEFSRNRNRGKTRWLLTSKVPFYDNQGNLAGLFGISRDITELKRTEEELRRHRDHFEELVEERTTELRRMNAELARTSRLKDEFLANMSHELRTPLTVVLGLVGSLQEGVYGELNRQQRTKLQTVEESGRHLLALITDILDFAKIGVGKLKLDQSGISVESVCQASLQFIKPIAQKKKLEVSTMFDPSVKTIHADGLRLKQILVNLLSNAAKFTPEGGKIGLEVTKNPEQPAIDFIVWDTGIGIAEEDLEDIFKPFVQLDGGLSRKHEGTGLGLSLVTGIVEMHGGQVSVESEVGKGSKFIVTIPCDSKEG